MQVEQLKELIINAIEDLKGSDVKVLDIKHLSSVSDYMIICSGRSNRHVKSIADNIIVEAKKNGAPAMSTQGKETGEWVLVDLGDIVAHVMQPNIRDLYNLESLWEMTSETLSSNDNED